MFVKVRVKVMHIPNTNILEMVKDKAAIAIAFKYKYK